MRNTTSKGLPLLFGIETEYAAAAISAQSNGEAIMLAAEHLMNRAQSVLHCLPVSDGSGLFLSNGSRFYIDAGGHPEMTTPECMSPFEIVRYLEAGDRIMRRLADVPCKADTTGDGHIFITRTNVDYTTKKHWGTHESYLCRRRPDWTQFVNHLAPHLCSRIIYSGAGGFDPHTPNLRFVLSPRACVLDRVVSDDTTRDRGIINTRQESLAGAGYFRFHLVCGESCFSQISNLLKVGTTALVVAMIDAGLKPGDGVRLIDPVRAIKIFAADPTCRATAATESERSMGGALTVYKPLTAVQIQRHYLRMARLHLDLFPAWAERLCCIWETTLDDLERGAPVSVQAKLDWAMKWALFRNHAMRRGLDWDGSIPAVDQGQEFFEVNSRFSQVAGKGEGIFAALDRAGVLRHRVPGIGQIERAETYPPDKGRARLRGRTIMKLSGQNGRWSSSWCVICDHETNKELRLDDPFGQQAQWAKCPERVGDHTSMEREVAPLTEYAAQKYRRGLYEQCFRLLTANLVAQAVPNCSGDEQIRYWRYRAWVDTRRGGTNGFALLDNAPYGDTRRTDYMYDNLSVARFQGLAVPLSKTAEWIERIERLREEDPANRSLDTGFLEHKAAYLLQSGRVAEACDILLRATQDCLAQHHIRGRSLALLAEAHRRLNRRRAALGTVGMAIATHIRNGNQGDLADYSLSILAKIHAPTNPRVALRCLTQAERLQTALRNHVGLVRTKLLQARLADSQEESRAHLLRATELVANLPAVRECTVCRRIMGNIDVWVRDKQSTDEQGDRFWGL